MAKQTFTTGQVLTAAQMTSLQQTAMGGGSTTAKTASYTLVAADAGTVVQMNSASATTITVNTGLFAAGDTVQIQNVGSGVCTVTAGTATVSTSAVLALKQYDAGSLYFNTTSAAIFFAVDAADGMTNPFTTTGDTVYASGGTTPTRLAIGSTGQVLTVASGIPSWATPASGGGMTLLSTTTLSGASTTISSISTSYIRLIAYIYGISNNTANGKLQVQPLGGTNTRFSGTDFSAVFYSTTSAITHSTNSDRTNVDNVFILTIDNYTLASGYSQGFHFDGYYYDGGNQRGLNIAGVINAGNSAVTSITFVQTGGNWATGTVKLYGVA